MGRLLRALVCLVLLGGASSAHAVQVWKVTTVYAQPTASHKSNCTAGQTFYGSPTGSALDVCLRLDLDGQSYGSIGGNAYYWRGTRSASMGYCSGTDENFSYCDVAQTISLLPGTGAQGRSMVRLTLYSNSGACPAGYVESGGGCVAQACPAGQEMYNGSCVPSCAWNETRVNGICKIDCQKQYEGNSESYLSFASGSSGCWKGCAVTPKNRAVLDALGGGPAYGVYAYTGSTCGADNGQEVTLNSLPDKSPGVCASGTVNNACISITKRGCGYVNGEYRCVAGSQLSETNPCTTTASGAMFCIGTAAVPPAPNAGVGHPADKAVPQAQFQLQKPDGTLVAVDYFAPSVVETGTGDGDLGNDDGGPEGGRGDCGSKDTPCHVVVDAGGTTGSGSGGDGGYGDGLGDCTGDKCGAAMPAFGGVKDFADSLASFVMEVQASQLATFYIRLASAIPQPQANAAPPQASFSLWGESFTYAVPDEVLDAVLPALRLFMKIFWCFVALRAFFD